MPIVCGVLYVFYRALVIVINPSSLQNYTALPVRRRHAVVRFGGSVSAGNLYSLLSKIAALNWMIQYALD